MSYRQLDTRFGFRLYLIGFRVNPIKLLIKGAENSVKLFMLREIFNERSTKLIYT